MSALRAQLLLLLLAPVPLLAGKPPAGCSGTSTADAVVLVQHAVKSTRFGAAASEEATSPLSPTGCGFQAGDEVGVEVIEGIPGSVMRGTVTGGGAVPGSYNVTVWAAPAEHRFMTDVPPESMQLWKATHRPPAIQQATLDLDLFSALDGDHDGAVSRGEFAQAIAQLAALRGSAAPVFVAPPAESASAAPAQVAPLQAAPPQAAPAVARPAAVPTAVASPDAAARAAPAVAPAVAAPTGPMPPTSAVTTGPAAPPSAAPSVSAAEPAPSPQGTGTSAQEVAAEAQLPSGQDCWVNGYTREACCDLYWGSTGDSNCWDGVFTFQRCCLPDTKVVREAEHYSEDLVAKRTSEEKEHQATDEREKRLKMEEEARERYDAEVRRKTREEEQRLFREQARKRNDGLAQQKMEAYTRRRAAQEEDAQLEREQKACPEGYQYVNGDVPGFDQFGHEDRLRRPKVELCAKECNKIAQCQSFEWSPTKLQCNLNKLAEPKASKYQDFTFCQRKKA